MIIAITKMEKLPDKCHGCMFLRQIQHRSEYPYGCLLLGMKEMKDYLRSRPECCPLYVAKWQKVTGTTLPETGDAAVITRSYFEVTK